MNDPKQALERDARLFESALREAWPRQDPRLRDLLERRPQWVELLDGPPAEVLGAGTLDGPDRRLTDELLALARRAPRTAQRRRGSPWLLAAAGVALCLGGLAWWSMLGAPAPERVQTLGGGEDGGAATSAVTCLLQAPAGPERGILSWKLAEPLGPGRSIEIVVRACAGEGQTGQELARKSFRASALSLQETPSSWTLDPEVLALAPDCLEWTVSLLDSSGFAIASDSARVVRSAH